MSTTPAAPGAPRLSVVIPSYERSERVVRLLDRLAEQTLSPGDFEVIVVDDGSRDNPRQAILARERPFHVAVLRQENQGPAAARHRGAEAARGEIILFLDDDMLPSPGFLKAHLDARAREPTAVVVGRMSPTPALAQVSLFERFHSRKLDEFNASVASGKRRPRGAELYTGNVSMRRADYFAVGGFDTSLRRSEDIELGIRLEKAGLPILFSAEAAAVHDTDHTDNESGLRRAFLYGVSEQRIGRKHRQDVWDASPWRFFDVVSLLPRPAFALAIAAPRAGERAARAVMRLSEALDSMGLERLALGGTMVAYGMEYFRGVRTEAGSAAACARDLRSFRRAHPTMRRRGPRRKVMRRAERKAAFARFLAGVRADHEMLRRADRKYDTRGREPGSLAHDLVERIGLQMMAGYRLMQLLKESGSPLGAKVAARMIRLLYGADIHWDAHIDGGVVINHGMGLAIGHAARIARGVILSHNVTIGAGRDPVTRVSGEPTIEEDVHIAPGAVLVGPITVGARSKIMPGAVVMQSVPPDSIVETPQPVIRLRARRPPDAAPRAEPGA